MISCDIIYWNRFISYFALKIVIKKYAYDLVLFTGSSCFFVMCWNWNLPLFLLTLSNKTAILNWAKTARGGFSWIIVIFSQVIILVKYFIRSFYFYPLSLAVFLFSYTWMMSKWWTIFNNCSSLNLEHRNFKSPNLTRHL